MNIQQILEKHISDYKTASDVGRGEKVLVSMNQVKPAINEIIKETLELAFEKSRIECNKGILREEVLVRDLEYDESYWVTINKQSILDVIKQIEI